MPAKWYTISTGLQYWAIVFENKKLLPFQMPHSLQSFVFIFHIAIFVYRWLLLISTKNSSGIKNENSLGSSGKSIESYRYLACVGQRLMSRNLANADECINSIPVHWHLKFATIVHATADQYLASHKYRRWMIKNQLADTSTACA